MRKLLCGVFLFFSLLSLTYAPLWGKAEPEHTLVMMWWNVENLFDCQNDPTTDDDEFTPNGRLHWTEKKLLLKQMRIRHLLSAVKAHPHYRKYPDLLAFAEVENRPLFQKTLAGVAGISYKSIYYESADPRGIDIGLAWNPQALQAGASKAYRVPLQEKPTRDIIVAGFSAEGKGFHVLLNHWPSRSFDTEWSEPKRMAAAQVARHILDSLLLGNPKADIILMGDFNDEPGNRSIQTVLGSTVERAKVKANGKAVLFNCWSGYKGIGSYFYKNRWQRFDQILLSSGMLDHKGLSLPENGFRCFAFSPLLDPSHKKPWPTYENGKYRGGYSDHLPLLLKVTLIP